MEFYKYQGTGNDFIMIDGRDKTVKFSEEEISTLCDRRFGIGADGLIIIKNYEGLDFEMDYYNADGTQSFCGNGSRCAQAFAKKLNIIADSSKFIAIDGVHQGKTEGDWFATKMGNVNEIELLGKDYFIYTGSPHYIKYVEDADEVDVYTDGKQIRNSPNYIEKGTNVNFVSIHKDYLKVRTYERGVEGETFSCGTGVTAVAISYLLKMNLNLPTVAIKTKGGSLRIDLNRYGASEFDNIWLVGPAEEVFKGEILV